MDKYPDAHLASDGRGKYILVDHRGDFIGRVTPDGATSVGVVFKDGRAFSVYGDGQYGSTEIDSTTGTRQTTLYKPDGTRIGLSPESIASNVAYGVGVTINLLSLVRAIQDGKPLPITVAGINTLAAVNPANTVLSVANSAVGAVTSLINLQKNIRNGDAMGTMVAGANLVRYSTAAYAGALQQSPALAAAGITQDIARKKAASASATATEVSTAVSYVNLAYCLSKKDYLGATLAAMALVFPGAAPFLAIAGVVTGMAKDQDLPSAIAGYKWATDGSVAIDVRWSIGGGDRIAASYLQNYLDALLAIVNDAQSKNPDAHLGLVANRLPSLQFSTHGCMIHDIDPVTGQQRSLSYDRDGRPTNAAPGTPEFFRSLNEQFIYSALGREAIAARWEGDTAWRQAQYNDPQAGLTELQRAQRNNQLAPAIGIDVATQGWRPVMLDLDGDGLQLVGKHANGVYFDIDGSGFLKNTAWLNPRDGFLVLDRNCNGFIEDGSELFSNGMVADAAKGLASLRWIDANVDGVIDPADPVFEHLRVWQDVNGNGTVDAGEAVGLRQRGVTSLHYTLGRYQQHGQSRQMASPELQADRVGTRTHTTAGGIVVESSNGTLSMIVTQTADLSHLKPGRDHISDAIEDIPIHILASVLLANDTLGGANGSRLRMTAVGDARHGAASLQHGVVHFTPDANYWGRDAGFSYTVADDDGRTSQGEVVITFSPVNDAPVIVSDGHVKRHIYGYDRVYSNGTLYDGNTNTNEVVMTVPVWTPSVDRPTPVDYVDSRRGKLTAVDPDDGTLTYGVHVPGFDSTPQPWPGGHSWAWGVRYDERLRAYVRDKAPRVFGTRLGWVTLENDGTWAYEPRVKAFLAPHDAFELTVTDSHGQVASTMVVIKMPPWEPPRYFENPIVLDLDRNGIELQAASASRAFYEIQDDGWRYRLGWISPGDGLLALDANGDGKISGRGELSFCDYVPGAQTDLEGLAGFDSNVDGKIDAGDAIWGRLSVWRDDNGDGESEPHEVMSLDQAGIAQVSLASDGRFATSQGNIIHGMTQVTMTDGSTLQAADAAFERTGQVLAMQPDGTREVIARAPYAAPSEVIGSDQQDMLLGTTGSNRIVAGDGNDMVLDDQGNDVIEGGGGDDSLHAGAHDDVVAGGTGNDTIFAGDGNDLLWGGEGADMLMAQAGDDILFGGDGDDLLFGEDGSDVLSGDAGNDLLYGGDGADALFGGLGDDLLSGGAGADQLHGDDGNDTLDGGAGTDTLVGGAGDDTYILLEPGDTVVELEGEGADTVRSAIDGYQLADHVENLVLVEPGAGQDAQSPGPRHAVGNALDNQLTGNRHDNLLDGGRGADRMLGGQGDDTYLVDDAGDRLVEREGEGHDTVIATVDHVMSGHIEQLLLQGGAQRGGGNAQDNVIHGNDLDNVLEGGEGADVLHGGIGDDTLDGGPGADRLIGGAGDDQYRVDHDDDVVIERAGGGIDTVNASVSHTLAYQVENLTLTFGPRPLGAGFVAGVGNWLDNKLIGSPHGWNALYGRAGDDHLIGSKHFDRLYGGSGDDLLFGDAGHDWMAGGAGNDTYLLLEGSGNDTLEIYREGHQWASVNRDVIHFGDIRSTQLRGLKRLDGDLVVEYGDNDSVRIARFFVDERARPAQFRFADAVGWSPDALLDAYAMALTNGPDELRLDNTRARTVYAKGGDDVIIAGSGNTALHGGDGNDTLDGGAGNDLLFGGNGDDVLNYSAGRNLLIGGAGDDILTTSWLEDIIAFNRGDGRDDLYLMKGEQKVMSLGGGIGYADLQLKKDGRDLMLMTGQDEGINLKGWYDTWYPDRVSHDLSTLQLILQDSSGYDANSFDITLNKAVQHFDFRQLVGYFDLARQQVPGLDRWSMFYAMPSAHIGASDMAAIGGDLAYSYARQGRLSGVADSAAQALLGRSDFGRMQPLGMTL
ncbi:cadherin-like domain-containing protein [Herbaspirillum sp. YR522]|uniref:Ig-like domain-containing protein n=1 Tax=Herbaspirillum sp. YR522 TaxID=1144342 RepID=UPI0002F82447|nr:cadherin-like domain-containing protein [Herbaspirillum sp. YR522]